VDWYLFQNSFYKKKPKFKDFDYFLISYPKISEEETNNLLTKINSIDDLVISSVIELRKEIVSMFSCIL
jgi:ERCC4-type nuclease